MRRLIVGGLLAVVALSSLAAQFRVRPVTDQDGRVALGLLLRKLGSTGTLMMTTAHPDDENNGLLALAAYDHGYRTILASATRGEGGQNEIGSELFDALAVLRTEELLAAHRFDGAEQYFTRAVDFGYSFSMEETYEKWGRDEIISDYVRLIRMHRPDVILALRPDGRGGGQHHQASARLAAEAFRAAADPGRYAEQLAQGLRPWQARKFYFMAGFGFRGETPPPPGATVVPVALGGYDALLGCTYAELGAEARSMHKCQGMPQVLPIAQRAIARYYLADSVTDAPADQDIFTGLRTTLPDLAQYVSGDAPAELLAALEEIASHVEQAQGLLDREGLDAVGPALASALGRLRTLRHRLEDLPALDEDARYEIDMRLEQKERQLETATLVAHGLRVEAFADDGTVAPGQDVGLTLIAANRGARPVRVEAVSLRGFDSAAVTCATGPVESGETFTCTLTARVPTTAEFTTPYFSRLPDTARYTFKPEAPFGLPFEPTPFVARIDLEVGGQRIAVSRGLEHRYEEDIFAGEKRTEIKVVPGLSVRVTPDIVVFPSPETRAQSPVGDDSGTPRAREVRVTVTNAGRGAVTGDVTLALRDGWTATPAASPVRFTREDESQTVRFMIEPPADAAPADYEVRARVSTGGGVFDRGYQVVDYPHIHRRHLVRPSTTRAKVVDVAIAPEVRVGYVMGVGDQVPAAIEQLGATVDMLDAEDLAWGDLSRYDVVVLGIRSYERRADLRANNARLLKWVEQGGTLIVQYNRREFNEQQYAPYPATIGRNRITDENAPVQMLLPTHPVFTSPNRIGPDSWEGWVQERGLYFLDPADPRYVDLIAMEDPFENNRGEKRGALVEARYGQGRWVYVALGLWRQLPAGTDGAYKLLANLLSLGKT